MIAHCSLYIGKVGGFNEIKEQIHISVFLSGNKKGIIRVDLRNNPL
jgi:hypothetical protein